MSGVSILAGLLTAEAVHQISQYVDDTDEELQMLLEGDDVSEEELKHAIKLVSEDQSKLERLYEGCRTILSEQGADESEINQALEPFRTRMA